MTVVTIPKLFCLLETLQSQGDRPLSLFVHLVQQHAKEAAVDKEHPASPRISLLGNTHAAIPHLFLIERRHTHKPFCTCKIKDHFPFKLYPCPYAAGVAEIPTWLSALQKIQRAEHTVHCRIPHAFTIWDPKGWCPEHMVLKAVGKFPV